jgi:transposase-like protein
MRNKYTEAYKTLAVNMVLEEAKMPVEVADNLGMPVVFLYKWIRQYKGMDSQGKTNASQEEIKRLKNEIQALKKQLAISEQYREILKKAATYFAVQTL